MASQEYAELRRGTPSPRPQRPLRRPVAANSLYQSSNLPSSVAALKHVYGNGHQRSASSAPAFSEFQSTTSTVLPYYQTQQPQRGVAPLNRTVAYDSDLSSDDSARQSKDYSYGSAGGSDGSSGGAMQFYAKRASEDVDISPRAPATALPSTRPLSFKTERQSTYTQKSVNASLYSQSSTTLSGTPLDYNHTSVAGPQDLEQDLLQHTRLRKLERLLAANDIRLDDNRYSAGETRDMKLGQLYSALSEIFGAGKNTVSTPNQDIFSPLDKPPFSGADAGTSWTPANANTYDNAQAYAPPQETYSPVPYFKRSSPTVASMPMPTMSSGRHSISLQGSAPADSRVMAGIGAFGNSAFSSSEDDGSSSGSNGSSDATGNRRRTSTLSSHDTTSTMDKTTPASSVPSSIYEPSRNKAKQAMLAVMPALPPQDGLGLTGDATPSTYSMSVTASSLADGAESVDLKPMPTLRPQDIAFRMSMLPEKRLTDQDGRQILAESFPQLCEPPARMFGEDGQPLPPTKKEEATAEERTARKNALELLYRGKQKHSLMKAMVIMESRSANWKRVGPSKASSAGSSSMSFLAEPLPDIPSPWTVEIYHQDLDSLRAQGKSRRYFELPDSRTNGQCPKCSGKGLDTCATCHGEDADECWWCAGSGMRKGYNQKCARCHGVGTLKCDACKGTLVNPCKSCEGQGHGEYAVNVEIKVRRIDFPPFPISSLIPNPHLRSSPEAVRSAAMSRTWALIQKLTESSNNKSKLAYMPVTAACGWETSVSHLVQVNVPLAAKLLKKKGSEPMLRAASLSRKIQTSKRYYIIPSDPDLRPAEMSSSEFEEAVRVDDDLDDGVHVPAVHHTDDLPSPKSIEIMTPTRNQFKPHPSPFQQLAQTPVSSRPGTPNMSRPGTPKMYSRPTTPGAAPPMQLSESYFNHLPASLPKQYQSPNPSGAYPRQSYERGRPPTVAAPTASRPSLAKQLFRSKSLTRLSSRNKHMSAGY